MTTVKTSEVLGKLERMVDFRIGKGASQKHPIEIQGGSMIEGDNGCPATDGTKIFLPAREKLCKKKRDNEMNIANSTAHEADHIREYEEYFGDEIHSIRNQGEGVVGVYLQRNHADLTENPALAGFIDNIVKDRRIDAQRCEQLPGLAKYDKEVHHDAIKYFRPSIKKMSELDAFREQFLQQALLGCTVEPVPEEHQQILEECVELCHSADSIYEDKEAVDKIYQIFKENFDIKQKIKRLPQQQGKGNHSKTPGSPQQGYGGEVKPREGRDKKEKRPKRLKKGKGKEEKPDPKGKKTKPKPSKHDKDRESLYTEASEDADISIVKVNPDYSDWVIRKEKELRDKYAYAIGSMKSIFRRLKQTHRSSRLDFSGQDLEYEEFLQTDLEREVTSISRNGRHFVSKSRFKHRPAWAVLADISPSTDLDHYNIINEIKAGLLIQGEALGVTDYPFGLFAFSGNLYRIKDFPETYNPQVANKIISVCRKSDVAGTRLAASSKAVGHVLERQGERPRGITIITDGESTDKGAPEVLKELYDNKVFPFVIVIGKEFDGYAKELTKHIGPKHYTLLGRDELHRLPDEMLRLFKTYGIA